MADILSLIIGVVVLVVLMFQIWALLRGSKGAQSGERFDSIERGQDRIAGNMREESGKNREELIAMLKGFNDSVSKQMTNSATLQNQHLENLTRTIGGKLESLESKVEKKLENIQNDNTAKLEEMRKTVDEKLQKTLEQRLGASFRIVSERLEKVQEGLGRMQELANGVGDLRRVLTNVKTRGTWGEIQLGNLLEQILAPGQYEKNVQTKHGSRENVEFAIKLPGRDEMDGQTVWLPIDSKFPKEDYERLVIASENSDVEAVESASKALEQRIAREAKSISEKYLSPPDTTDFAIMFFPCEGLYGEALRRPGLVEKIQRDNRVVVAGPTTLAALLNSLQMGFRTLAIQKQSSEVWKVLSAVKTEFGKFGDVIDRVQKKLNEASNAIESDVAVRTRAINRKLRTVEELSADVSENLLED